MRIEDKLKELFKLREIKAGQEAQVKDTEAKISALQIDIVDEFESRQIRSMKIDGMGNFVMAVIVAPKVVDPVAFKDWMLENSVPMDTVTAVHAKKFRAWYKELMENNQPLPKGCEVYTEAQIRVAKEA